jgi:hypothetical protein
LTGSFLDPDAVLEAIVTSRRSLPPMPRVTYAAFVDMSGGSSDDACLSIAHKQDGKVLVDLVEKQAGNTPFNPRDAVRKFAGLVKSYGLRKCFGDAYAGETFKRDFENEGIQFLNCGISKSTLYEGLEPRINAGEIELPNVPKLQEQLLGLVYRGTRIDHTPNEHDDFANAVAGSVWAATVTKPRSRTGTYTVGGVGGIGRISWKYEEPEPLRLRYITVDGRTGETLKESISVMPRDPKWLQR